MPGAAVVHGANHDDVLRHRPGDGGGDGQADAHPGVDSVEEIEDKRGCPCRSRADGLRPVGSFGSFRSPY